MDLQKIMAVFCPQGRLWEIIYVFTEMNELF